EVAVGANWNPSDTVDSGSVHYLIPPEDRTQRWTPVALHHEPTGHRMHWVMLAPERFGLVVSPGDGGGNGHGEDEGARRLASDVHEDPRQPWKTTLIDDTMHMSHNLAPVQWDRATESEDLLYIGREGAMLLSWTGDQSQRHKFDR